MPTKQTSAKKHIIAIRLSAMGDVAMTVPVLRALTTQYPKVKVTVVSRSSYQPFFEDIHNVNFFAAEVEGRHKGVFGLIRLYKDLKALKVYGVADLHNVLRSKVVTAIFSIRGKKTATLDKAREEKKALIRAHNKIFAPLTPMVQKHAEVFKKLGFAIDLSQPVFPEPKMPDDEVLAISGKKGGQWIGIAPFAQHRSKIYPLDLMHKVIDVLATDSNRKLFLFGGGKTETETLRHFANGKDNVVVVAGKLKLKQELRLISNLDLMLSMDSGNAHMAAMLGINVVTLWGATHPYTGFGPFNQPYDNAIVSDREQFPLLPTSVYGDKKVKGYEDVMRSIPPEAVVNKINDILKKG